VDGSGTGSTAAGSTAADVGRNLAALAGHRVVFLNWRDLAHPQAGGAELYCQSVAERFAAAGARVTLLTARPDGLPAVEQVRGVTVRRAGGTFGVYQEALRWLAAHRRRVDAVVDCQNGIPFFSPLALRRVTPVVQVLHHVHQRQFPLYFPGPAARVGQLLESDGSRRVYGRRPIAAVSPSTRAEAREVLGLAGPRHLVPNGVTPAPTGPRPEPAGAPAIVCVGRLVPHKRLHLLLDAVATLRARWPSLEVHLVGDGPDRDRLTAHAAGLGLAEPTVRWHGYVDAGTRDRLLATAWLTVNPSHGEGWGLSVLEANAYGVPAVAYDVPGLRDAVRDGVTGWLAADGAPLAPTLGRALAALADPVVATAWRDRARAWAGSFSWDATADLLAALVRCEADRLSRGRPDRRRDDEPVTLAEFARTGGEPLPALRRTDLVHGGAEGTGVALLYGASGPQCRAALRRAGVTGDIVTRPATGQDLLLAAGRSVLTVPGFSHR
jgi:glycosyltransferase involved in cell wall biosynthesis